MASPRLEWFRERRALPWAGIALVVFLFTLWDGHIKWRTSSMESYPDGSFAFVHYWPHPETRPFVDRDFMEAWFGLMGDEDALANYRQSQVVDSVLLLGVIPAFAFLIVFTWSRVVRARIRVPFVLTIPMVPALVLDLLENAILYRLSRSYPDLPERVLGVLSVTTGLKIVSYVLATLILIVGMTVLLIRRMRGLAPPARSDG